MSNGFGGSGAEGKRIKCDCAGSMCSTQAGSMLPTFGIQSEHIRANIPQHLIKMCPISFGTCLVHLVVYACTKIDGPLAFEQNNMTHLLVATILHACLYVVIVIF